jgi:hypothetical protein
MWYGLSGLDERAAFKRTADGYVFRAPTPWLIGPARHYLVDEATKDEIACALSDIRTQRANMLILVLAAALVGLVVSIGFRDHLLPAAALGFALLVAFVAVAGHRQLVALQPLLADLPPTAERITWRDRLTAASAATSYPTLVILGLTSMVITLANALQLAEQLGRADGDARPLRLVVAGMCVVSFAAVAAIDFGIAYLKLKNRPR